MAENKKSFLLHLDSLDILDVMTDDQVGKLLRAMRDFHKGQEPDLDQALKIAFLPFRNQFWRDNISYEKVVERNRINGFKGGRPEKPKETQKTQTVISKPKKADNDNDNDKKEKGGSSIEDRTLAFKTSLYVFSSSQGGKYQNDLLKAFFNYWSEPNKSKTKMRFELQQTWDTSRRLVTWASKEFNQVGANGALEGKNLINGAING